MPLLNAHALTHSPDLHLHTHTHIHEVEEGQEASPAPASSSPVTGVLTSTRASWPLVLFHLLILLGSVAYAADASAQPVEGVGLSPEALQAVAGDPWATVVVAALFVGGQVASAVREWAKVRGSELEKARSRIEVLEVELLGRAKEVAKLEAERDLARFREGDARAAVSGVVGRPEVA